MKVDETFLMEKAEELAECYKKLEEVKFKMKKYKMIIQYKIMKHKFHNCNCGCHDYDHVDKYHHGYHHLGHHGFPKSKCHHEDYEIEHFYPHHKHMYYPNYTDPFFEECSPYGYHHSYHHPHSEYHHHGYHDPHSKYCHGSLQEHKHKHIHLHKDITEKCDESKDKSEENSNNDKETNHKKKDHKKMKLGKIKKKLKKEKEKYLEVSKEYIELKWKYKAYLLIYQKDGSIDKNKPLV